MISEKESKRICGLIRNAALEAVKAGFTHPDFINEASSEFCDAEAINACKCPQCFSFKRVKYVGRNEEGEDRFHCFNCGLLFAFNTERPYLIKRRGSQ